MLAAIDNVKPLQLTTSLLRCIPTNATDTYPALMLITCRALVLSAGLLMAIPSVAWSQAPATSPTPPASAPTPPAPDQPVPPPETDRPGQVRPMEPGSGPIAPWEVAKFKVGDKAPIIKLAALVQRGSNPALHTSAAVPPPATPENPSPTDPATVVDIEPGFIYVIDIFTRYNRESRTNPTIFNLIAKKHADAKVLVLGVNVDAERNQNGSLETWMNKCPEKPTYAVGADAEGFPVANGYMLAAMAEEPPITFIVDRAGKLAWFGPAAKTAAVVDAMVAGTFDAAKSEAERRAEVQRKIKEFENIQAMAKRLNDAIVAGDWKQVDAIFEEAKKAGGDVADQVEIDRVMVLLTRKNDIPGAKALIKRLVAEDYKDNPKLLQRLAQALTFSDISSEQRDSDGAEAAVKRMLELKHEPALGYAMWAKIMLDRADRAGMLAMLDKADAAAADDDNLKMGLAELRKQFIGTLDAATKPPAPAPEPAKNEPAKNEPAKTEPVKTEPTKAEPPKR